jgi:hypothetical protein
MRQQADRDLLAGGGDHVELALQSRRRLAAAQFLGEAEQAVGLAAHRRGTTTIWWPARAHLATRLATLRMRSVEPIEVPPYL